MDGVRDDDRFRCSVFGVGVGVINLCHFHPVLSIAASGFLEMNIQLGPQLVVRSSFLRDRLTGGLQRSGHANFCQ
jgi:hypothetical protein